MIIETKYDIGQMVYLITEDEQAERMVVGIMISPTGKTYKLAYSTTETWHYEIELSADVNQVKKLGINKIEE